MNQELIKYAAKILERADRVVCLTGAGVSAESGISTFRDPETGLWTKFNLEELASQEGFRSDPGKVWRWYAARVGDMGKAQPNPGHVAIAEIAQRTEDFTMVTQNVDNLHERGGCESVIHLHGTIGKFRCNECTRDYDVSDDELTADQPPHCPHCNGLVRADVVWFGEAMPRLQMDRAWKASENCQVMLVVGTSGIVYPAAYLPLLASENGATIIDINPDYGEISRMADVHIPAPSGEALPAIVAAMG
ncbi:MAG: NAD-dependent deacylase [Chloroflexota bacterium]